MRDIPRQCPSCGVELPANAPDGICPRCLLRNALGGDGPEPFSHEVSVSFEPGRTSVLASLAESIGGVPHVLLRDTDPRDDTSPVVRPASPEMPGPEGLSSRYQFLGEIARGGMGAVLKGRDPDLGRDLAIKVLLEAHRDKPELIRRFIEEAQIGGQLQHPGIVPVYELGSFADRRPFFAMKLVKGRTLSSLLAERSFAAPAPVGAGSVRRSDPGTGKSDQGTRRSDRATGQSDRGTEPPPTKRPDPAHDLPRFLAIFESVCQTMAYSHARGVIHRDLKPSNVMVGSFGEVQVMDWGLAKVLPSGGAVDDQPPQCNEPEPVLSVIHTARTDEDASQAGSVLGTPGYMAPEQARGDVELVDERVDVFGLGAILCEILTGEAAFTGAHGGRDPAQGRARRPGRGVRPPGRLRRRSRADRPGQGLPGARAGRPSAAGRTSRHANHGLPDRRTRATPQSRAGSGGGQRTCRGGKKAAAADSRTGRVDSGPRDLGRRGSGVADPAAAGPACERGEDAGSDPDAPRSSRERWRKLRSLGDGARRGRRGARLPGRTGRLQARPQPGRTPRRSPRNRHRPSATGCLSTRCP